MAVPRDGYLPMAHNFFDQNNLYVQLNKIFIF